MGIGTEVPGAEFELLHQTAQNTASAAKKLQEAAVLARCNSVVPVLDWVRGHGFRCEQLFAGASFDEASLRADVRRIPWSDYVRFYERLAEEVGGVDALRPRWIGSCAPPADRARCISCGPTSGPSCRASSRCVSRTSRRGAPGQFSYPGPRGPGHLLLPGHNRRHRRDDAPAGATRGVCPAGPPRVARGGVDRRAAGRGRRHGRQRPGQLGVLRGAEPPDRGPGRHPPKAGASGRTGLVSRFWTWPQAS